MQLCVVVMMTTTSHKLLSAFRSRAILLLIVILLSTFAASAQSTTPAPNQSPTVAQPGVPPPLQFEVASIRPHRSANDESSNRKMLPGGRFIATATSVRTLIRIAFGSDRISGAPSWIDNEIFDINATTEGHADVTTAPQFQQLILSLLEERFQLKFHREEKETPVFWLQVNKPGRLGPALKPSAPDAKPNMSTNSNGARAAMKASKMSMADIAAALSRQAGRPVEDRTNLKGDFDLQIEWAPEENPDSADPALFTVLREQLGLKLQPAKGTAPTFVIDQVMHPSAN
jgi:uncharacterized protein (TIGR03435 family)